MTINLSSGKSEKRPGAAAWSIAFAIGMVLSACQPAPQPQESVTETPVHRHAHATRYTIDPANSSIILRAYRDGPLARYGHNHVIAIRQLQGVVYREADMTQSEVEMRFPVNSMRVDSPDDRASAGPDFSGVLAPEAIAGTRANMLGPQLLAAAQYPEVALRSIAVSGQWPELQLIVEVNIRQLTSRIVLPVRMSETDDLLIAEGSVRLSQVRLGLTPYSVLGGGLRIADAIDAQFHITARKDSVK